MRNEYFVYNNISSLDMGINLQKQIEIENAEPNVETITVPGKNGALTYWDGTYQNRVVTAKCFVLNENAADYLEAISVWLVRTPGYLRLEMSQEPNVFMLARVSSMGTTSVRNGVLVPLEIKFDCMPQKFLKSGEQISQVKNGGNVYNAWLPAKPLIHISCQGTVSLTMGESTIKLAVGGTKMQDYYIDCETQNIYDRFGASANSKAEVDEFPLFDHGETSVAWTGGLNGTISKVEITPRWWTL